MDHIDSLSDRELEALLAGRATSDDDPDLAELAEFIRAARAANQPVIDPATEQLHLSAILEAAYLTAQSKTGLSPTPRRNKMLRSKWTKVAAVAVVAFTATTGMAAANVLPAPAQDAVSAAADVVGFDLPKAEEKAARKAAKAEEKAAKDEAKAARKAAEVEGATGPSGPSGPSGPHGKSVADDVHAVLDDDSLEGREKGQAVSEAASQNRQNETHSHSKKGPKGPTGPSGP